MPSICQLQQHTSVECYLTSDVTEYKVRCTEVYSQLQVAVTPSDCTAWRRHASRWHKECHSLQTRPRLCWPDLQLMMTCCAGHQETPQLARQHHHNTTTLQPSSFSGCTKTSDCTALSGTCDTSQLFVINIVKFQQQNLQHMIEWNAT